jgi:hypothetical protein
MPALLNAVQTLLRAAQQDCTSQMQAAILQQLTDSGLFKAFDQLREATALQLEQDATATAAVAGSNDAVERLQLGAARLLLFQVGWTALHSLLQGNRQPSEHTCTAYNVGRPVLPSSSS